MRKKTALVANLCSMMKMQQVKKKKNTTHAKEGAAVASAWRSYVGPVYSVVTLVPGSFGVVECG